MPRALKDWVAKKRRNETEKKVKIEDEKKRKKSTKDETNGKKEE